MLSVQCLVIPPVSIFSIIVISLIIKWLSKAWIRFRYEDGHLYELLSVFDQAFTITPCDVMVNYILKTESVITDINQLRSQFRKTFFYPETKTPGITFRYTLDVIWGFAYKKPIPVEKLDLSRHIREDFCDKGVNEDEFVKIVLEDNSRINTWDVPNWEIVLVHFPHEKRTTLLFKISHWMADGISCRLLIDTLTGNETVYKIPKAGKPLTWKRTIKILCKAPLGLWKILSECRRFSLSYPWIPEEQPKVLNLPVSIYQATFTLDFRKLKRIGELRNCKILTLLVSLHISTIKRLFRNQGRLNENTLELQRSMFALPLPAPQHPAIFEKRCTNYTRPDLLCAPMHHSDPLEQLHHIHKRISHPDDDVDGPLIVLWSLNIFAFLPYKFLMPVVRYYFLVVVGKSSLVFVNPMVFSPNPYKVQGSLVSSLHSVIIVNPKEDFSQRNMLLTPVTRETVMDISVRASSLIFPTQKEADGYGQMFVEEIDKMLSKLNETEENKTE